MPDEATFDGLLNALVAAAGIAAALPGLPSGVEAIRRRAADGRSWVALVNHTDAPATMAVSGVDLLSGHATDGSLTLPRGGVAVVREG